MMRKFDPDEQHVSNAQSDRPSIDTPTTRQRPSIGLVIGGGLGLIGLVTGVVDKQWTTIILGIIVVALAFAVGMRRQ
jgi:hypothetical protein